MVPKDWYATKENPDFQLAVNVAARQFFDPGLAELMSDLAFEAPDPAMEALSGFWIE